MNDYEKRQKNVCRVLEDNNLDKIIERVYQKEKQHLDFIEYYTLRGFKGDCLDFYYLFGVHDLVRRGILDNIEIIKDYKETTTSNFIVFLNTLVNNCYGPLSAYIYNIYQIKQRGKLLCLNYEKDEGLYIEYVIDELCTDDDYINHQCDLHMFFPDKDIFNYLNKKIGALGSFYVLEFYEDLKNKLKYFALECFNEILKEIWGE